MDEKMLLKVIIRTIFALVKKKQAENSLERRLERSGAIIAVQRDNII